MRAGCLSRVLTQDHTWQRTRARFTRPHKTQETKIKTLSVRDLKWRPYDYVRLFQLREHHVVLSFQKLLSTWDRASAKIYKQKTFGFTTTLKYPQHGVQNILFSVNFLFINFTRNRIIKCNADDSPFFQRWLGESHPRRHAYASERNQAGSNSTAVKNGKAGKLDHWLRPEPGTGGHTSRKEVKDSR